MVENKCTRQNNLKQMGVLDFAGGIVVHTTAGSGSAVCALFLGRRGFYDEHSCGDFPPSNLPLALVGAGLLFCGWFGFVLGFLTLLARPETPSRLP